MTETRKFKIKDLVFDCRVSGSEQKRAGSFSSWLSGNIYHVEKNYGQTLLLGLLLHRPRYEGIQQRCLPKRDKKLYSQKVK